MPKAAILLILTFLCHPAPLSAKSGPQADPICLARKCGKTMMECGIDKECRSWLQCVLKCGNDKIRCPSFCGFFYQSPMINQTSLCIFESQCVELGFNELPHYEHAERPSESLRDIEGTYWFAASFGGRQIFDYDCQRFDFKPMSDELLAVTYSVPLTNQGETRIKGAKGVFRQNPSGAIEVIYDNFAGYHEKWFLVDKTEQTLLAHVCIDAGVTCYDYGTILLSKVDLSRLGPLLPDRLDPLTTELFGFGWQSFHLSATHDCPNQ